MKQILFMLFMLCFCFIACSDSEKLDDSIKEKILQVTENFILENDISAAMSVSIYNKKYTFTHNTGYTSISKKTLNTEETLHYIYSISKTFTCAEILHLVELGKINLTDKVKDFFPEFSENFFINENATIEQLLNHTSGIYDYVENPKLFSKNPFLYESWNPMLLLDFIEHTSTESGGFNYSSANFILLGKIAEIITEKNLNELFKTDFIEPLNISNFFLSPQDIIEYEKISHPHVYPGTELSLIGDGKTPIDVVSIIPNLIEVLGMSSWAAGGIVSNATEIARWGFELYSKNGKAVSSVVREQILNSLIKNSVNEEEIYGFGTRKIFYNTHEFIGSYGRSLGSENLMFYNSETDSCFVILTSCNFRKDKTPNIDELLFKLFECIYESY